jgi:hypothetical protein
MDANVYLDFALKCQRATLNRAPKTWEFEPVSILLPTWQDRLLFRLGDVLIRLGLKLRERPGTGTPSTYSPAFR